MYCRDSAQQSGTTVTEKMPTMSRKQVMVGAGKGEECGTAGGKWKFSEKPENTVGRGRPYVRTQGAECCGKGALPPCSLEQDHITELQTALSLPPRPSLYMLSMY